MAPITRWMQLSITEAASYDTTTYMHIISTHIIPICGYLLVHIIKISIQHYTPLTEQFRFCNFNYHQQNGKAPCINSYTKPMKA